jgi:hypothetical protein
MDVRLSALGYAVIAAAVCASACSSAPATPPADRASLTTSAPPTADASMTPNAMATTSTALQLDLCTILTPRLAAVLTGQQMHVISYGPRSDGSTRCSYSNHEGAKFVLFTVYTGELARREWRNNVGYGLTMNVPGVGYEAKRDPNGSFLHARKGDRLCSIISGHPNERQQHFDIVAQLCVKALEAP